MQHLQDLKRKFSDWRAKKLIVSEPVPNELWKEVNLALEYTHPGLLSRHLKITKNQMRLHCGLIKNQTEPSCDDKFIEIAPVNKKTSLLQINKTIPKLVTGSEKHEVLFTINNQSITLKFLASNLLTVLHDLKKAL